MRNRLNPSGRYYVAGHQGLVGSALCRALRRHGIQEIITATRAQLDLRDQRATRSFLAQRQPTCVFMAAATVGGIGGNSATPATYLYDNLAIGTNLVEASRQAGVQTLINLGSSCIYPRDAHQPMKEDVLLSGPLEPTNRGYAVAKIAVAELCRHYRQQFGLDFITAMPTNIYGPGDRFDLESSHVVPAMIRKFSEHQHVRLWGTGRATREFIYADDVAEACVFLAANKVPVDIVNVGTGEEVSIAALSKRIASGLGFRGTVEWEHDRPQGPLRKVLDCRRLTELGFRPTTSLDEGLRRTIEWFRTYPAQWRRRLRDRATASPTEAP